MIIFTPIKEIPVEYLEYKNIRQVVRYNLSSYFAGAPALNFLLPSGEYMPEDIITGDNSTPQFDIEYHNYILTNNNAFNQFVSMIIQVYNNPDILIQIIIGDSPYRNAITESLIKLIQQRYGYNAYIVNEIEDFLYIEEPDFSIPGLFTMDQDLNKWQSMNGGVINEQFME